MTPPTPGPWRASQVSFANWWAVFDSANEIAATNIRVEANARLIAEAPEMLTSLGEALLDHKPCDLADCWCPKATRVYDAARGVV